MMERKLEEGATYMHIAIADATGKSDKAAKSKRDMKEDGGM